MKTNNEQREKVFNRILNLIKNNPSGFTATATGLKLNLKKGYAVSITNNKDKVVNELINKALVLNHLSTTPFYFGGWYDKKSKNYFLDLTKIESNKTEALKTAQHFKQKAVFNFSNLKEIKVK